MSVNDLPIRHSSHELDDAGDAAFRSAVAASGVFIVQSADRRDYGVDYTLEVISNGRATNARVQIQLKSSDADGPVRADRTNLNYLLTQPHSHYVSFVRPKRQLRAISAHSVFVEYQSRDGWQNQTSISVRPSQAVDAAFLAQLAGRVLAHSQMMRDDRLASAEHARPRRVLQIQGSRRETEVQLRVLYDQGEDELIHQHFSEFEAVLGGSRAMDLVYLAEVNRGLSGGRIDESRVRAAISWFQSNGHGIANGSRLYVLGNAHLVLREIDNARSRYEEALALLEGSDRELAAMCAKNLSSALDTAGDPRSETVLRRALELDPTLAEGHLALARLLARRGQLDEAIAEFDQVVPRKGSLIGRAVLLYERTCCVLRNRDLRQGFVGLSALLADAHDNEWIWESIIRAGSAFVPETENSILPALAFWRSVRRERPSDERGLAGYLRTMAELQICAPLRADALQSFVSDVASLSEGTTPIWIDRVAHYAERAGELHVAESKFREAARANAWFAGCLVRFLNTRSRFQDAIAAADQFSSESASAAFHFEKAFAHEKRGQVEDAIRSYRAAIGVDPGHDAAWFNLGGLHFNTGDVTEARAIWSEAEVRFPSHPLLPAVRRALSA